MRLKKLLSFILASTLLISTAFADSFQRGGGLNEGDLEMQKYSVQFAEVDATPICPPSDQLKIYSKDDSGTTKLYTLDSACAETALGSVPPETDPYAIYKNGSSTTSASIPFAQGISISTTKLARFGGTSDSTARAKLYDDTSSFYIQGLMDSSQSNGANLKVYGGDAGAVDMPGGYVRLYGGSFLIGSDTQQNGFVTVGTSTTGFTLSSVINGATTSGNNRNDFAVEGNFYNAGRASFANGIGVGGNLLTASGQIILGPGDSAQSILLDRNSTTAGVSLTIQGGWAKSGGTNLAGGSVILAPGKATGSGLGSVIIQAIGGGSSGTTDASPSTVATWAKTGVTLADPYDFVLGTTTGTKFGTSTSQKLAFYNSSPIVQPGATTDLGTVLSNLGLRASGTAYPITTSGAVNFTGGVTIATTNLTITNKDVVLGTTTGTKFGTATTQKLAFYNSTPIVKPIGNALTALSQLGLVGSPTLTATNVGLGNLDNYRQWHSLASEWTDAQDSGSGSETDLYVNSLDKSVWTIDGQGSQFVYGGLIEGSVATTQQIKVYFDGQVIFDTGTLAVTSGHPYWKIVVDATMIPSTGNGRFTTSWMFQDASYPTDVQYVELSGLNFGSPIDVKITGTSSGSPQVTVFHDNLSWKPKTTDG